MHRGVAQLVEYRSPKPWVAGSSPPAPANNRSRKASVFFFSVFFCTKAVFYLLFQPFSQSTRKHNRAIYHIVCHYFRTVQHQKSITSVKRASRRPQIFFFCGRSFSLFSPTQFLRCYRQKSLVMPVSKFVSFFT